MDSAYTAGRMGELMKAFIWTIRSMDTGFTLGQIRKSTQAGGSKASSMDWASSFPRKYKTQRIAKIKI